MSLRGLVLTRLVSGITGMLTASLLACAESIIYATNQVDIIRAVNEINAHLPSPHAAICSLEQAVIARGEALHQAVVVMLEGSNSLN